MGTATGQGMLGRARRAVPRGVRSVRRWAGGGYRSEIRGRFATVLDEIALVDVHGVERAVVQSELADSHASTLHQRLDEIETRLAALERLMLELRATNDEVVAVVARAFDDDDGEAIGDVAL